MTGRLNSSDNTFMWVIGAFLIVIFIGGLFLLAKSSKELSKEERISIINNNANHTVGGVDAEVVLVVFSDFECPSCASFVPVLKQIEENYGDKVKIVFKHFPLNAIHRNAQLAAETSEAAGAQGKFWQMHDVLFENQSDWSSLSGEELLAELKEYAQEIGVEDLERFSSEISSSEYEAAVEKDLLDANKLDLNSTPTVFLDGEKLTDRSFLNLKLKIDELLSN